MQELAGRVAIVTGAASVLRRRLDALEAGGALLARHP
jgi:hypothetical protein